MNENRIVLKRTNKRDAVSFLLFVFLLPYVCACLWGHVGEETDILRQEGEEEAGYEVQALMQWGVWRMPLEEYLAYKLESVMPETYEPEAMKAQAVLLRTEVAQVLKEEESEGLQVSGEGMEKWYGAGGSDREELAPYREAVEETDGLYLSYRGEPIQASYFKVSNGRTRNAAEVWRSGRCPYLSGADCVQDKAAQDYASVVTVSKADYLRAIASQAGQGYEQEELCEEPALAYDEAGYVTEVSFLSDEKEGVQIDGETFRYLFALPSASFEMERQENQVVFRVTGVGHGFGMSQYGANCRAINGETYDEILKYFFTGTELAKFE